MDRLVNIGRNQRITRSLLGLILIVAGIGLTLLQFNWSLPLYILFFVFMFSGVLTFIEGLLGVCPVNAYRGRQSMKGYFSLGLEKVEDPELVAKFKQVANKEIAISLAISICATALVILLIA